jgi:hypothetical protein
VVSFDIRSIYTAISYSAANINKTQFVQVNGTPLNAFANLGHAIEETYRYRQREYPDFEVLLWTDQICIDQSDKVERPHQVGFMIRIYGSAGEVAVCLSTVEFYGGSALTWVEDFYKDVLKLPIVDTLNNKVDSILNPKSSHVYTRKAIGPKRAGFDNILALGCMTRYS